MVLALGDARSVRPELVGAKAANLAIAARAGLRVLPGFVVTTDAVAHGLEDPDTVATLRTALHELGAGPVVVRSSSTIEDAGESSMAGRFTSVLGVCGWDDFHDAAQRVAASADAVRDIDGTPAAIGILVQPMLDARFGGVMFAKDPLTGRSDRLVVEVVAGGPDALVSGRALAARWVLSPHGRVLDHTSVAGVPELDRADRRSLARLAAAATRCFGSPQDIEWAVGRDAAIVLLQSRPVTATGDVLAHGPLLGPGPVSETFPDQLTEREQWLWLEPLRDGIARALLASGAVSPRRVRESPVVTSVDGFAVVDLDLFGLAAHHVPVRRRFRPAAIGRRLISAWRVGRLRVALPALIDQVISSVDAHLAAVPAPRGLGDDEIEALMERGRRELATVHCFEALAGMLLDEHDSGGSAALSALRALHRSRAAGLDDATIVAREPIVLCLAPPTLAHPIRLPEAALRPERGPVGREMPIGRRDALRVRTRWLQELIGRAALEQTSRRGVTIDTLHRRLAPPPVAFRLSAHGDVIAAGAHGSGLVGQPASPGRAVGVVRHRASSMTIDDDTILVTRTLDPALAAVLPGLAGLVTETGSSLSHLAILAREERVPTVVAVDHAVSRLPAGTRIAIDGGSGCIEILEREEADA